MISLSASVGKLRLMRVRASEEMIENGGFGGHAAERGRILKKRA